MEVWNCSVLSGGLAGYSGDQASRLANTGLWNAHEAGAFLGLPVRFLGDVSGFRTPLMPVVVLWLATRATCGVSHLQAARVYR
jgi:hypothetical protein